MRPRPNLFLLALAACTGSPEPDTTEESDVVIDTGPFFAPDVDCGEVVLPDDDDGALKRFPYLQWPATDAMTVAWGTTPGATTELRWGPDADLGQTAAPTGTQAITELEDALDLHHVRLDGLSPGTPYCYAIAVDGAVVASGLTLRTAPDGERATIRAVVMGDYGNGSDAQAQIRDRIAERVATERIDLWLTTGDNAYSDGRHQEFQDRVFDVYKALWHGIPVLPTPGNHDWGSVAGNKDDISPYMTNFFLPEHDNTLDHPEDYYDVTYGPMHWVALDSHFEIGDTTTTGSPITRLTEDVPGDDMLDWATDSVGRAGDRWTIAGWHHPAYTGQLDRTPELHVVLKLLPWVESQPVHMVLNGHNHLYERFTDIRMGARVEEDGQTFIVTGGGGAGLYEIGDLELREVGESVNHYLWLEMDRCTLKGEAVRGDGSILDTFTMTRCEG